MSIRRGIRWGCGLTIGYLLVMAVLVLFVIIVGVFLA